MRMMTMRRTRLGAWCPPVLVLALASCTTNNEHAGQPTAVAPGQAESTTEHAGKEHAGKEHAGREHAGREHAGRDARDFTAEEIKAAMTAHIRAEIERGGGVFKIADAKANQTLSLEFVKIHDPVRKIEGKGYFACTDFHPVGSEATKLYDLDFWLNPTDGKLVVTETRIHKHPVRDGAGWKKEARYTFINDKPVEVR